MFKNLLFVLAVAASMAGAVIYGESGALQEIKAFILFLISAVFASGAGIVEAVERLRQELFKRNKHRRQ